MTAAVAVPRTFARPGLGRLTAVELRKMVDTRARFWLAFTSLALVVVAVVVLLLVADEQDQVFRAVLEVAVQPPTILLPIVGILLVSSEWSQRTGQVTFSLVPRRSRVFAAKVLAALASALIAFVVCVAVAALGTAIAAPPDAWSFSAGNLVQFLIAALVPMLIGVGFGAVLLSSPPAIVLYFALPIVWAALGAIPALDGIAPWLDQAQSMPPLTGQELMSGEEWGQLATTLALWMVVPLVAGLVRVLRSEVR